MWLLTGDGETLAELADPPDDDREAASRVLDVCASSTLVHRFGNWCRVAFYHPLTTQVGVGVHPVWSVFRCPSPTPVPVEGMVVSLREGNLLRTDGTLFAVPDTPLSPHGVLALAAADTDIESPVGTSR